MVLVHLRSCIHLVYPHLFTMVSEGRRVFAGLALTDTITWAFFFLFILGFWSSLQLIQ